MEKKRDAPPFPPWRDRPLTPMLYRPPLLATSWHLPTNTLAQPRPSADGEVSSSCFDEDSPVEAAAEWRSAWHPTWVLLRVMRVGYQSVWLA